MASSSDKIYLDKASGLRVETEDTSSNTHHSTLSGQTLNIDDGEVVLSKNWLYVRDAGFSTVNGYAAISNGNHTSSVPYLLIQNANTKVTDNDGTEGSQQWSFRVTNGGYLSLFSRTQGSAVNYGASHRIMNTVTSAIMAIGTNLDETDNEGKKYIENGVPNSQTEFGREPTCNLYVTNWARFTSISAGFIAVTDLRQNTESDSRLKNISASQPDCISKIKSLGDVVSYRYKSPEELTAEKQPSITTLDLKNEHTGLLYQNAEKADIPTFTGKNEKGYGYINYVSPDYQAILLGAVQELIRRVEYLENKVK